MAFWDDVHDLLDLVEDAAPPARAREAEGEAEGYPGGRPPIEAEWAPRGEPRRDTRERTRERARERARELERAAASFVDLYVPRAAQVPARAALDELLGRVAELVRAPRAEREGD